MIFPQGSLKDRFVELKKHSSQRTVHSQDSTCDYGEGAFKSQPPQRLATKIQKEGQEGMNLLGRGW